LIRREIAIVVNLTVHLLRDLVSPLHAACSSSSSDGRRTTLTAVEYPNLGYLVLRGKADSVDFMDAVGAVIGAALPTLPRSLLLCPAGVVLWQSQDEWWLICARGSQAGLAADLSKALENCFSQVVDNSGGFTAVHLAGPDCNIVLRHLTPYDIDSLERHRCVSIPVGKASITVIRTSDQGLTLVFRRSFASYLWQLIDRAALPYGMKMVSPQEAADGLLSTLLVAKDQVTAAKRLSQGLK
jgi:sarcosine oxidase subunit gamma